MLDDTNYLVPPNSNTPKHVNRGGFLMTVYALIGIAVGATWPLWVLLMVAL